MHSVIVKPIITEKSMQKAAKGEYTFGVTMSSTKPIVKKAVEKLFNVHVKAISMVITKEKMRRVGKRREEVMLQPQKKAIVTVATGEKIDLFETKG